MRIRHRADAESGPQSNPSTGYGWQVQGAGSGILRQVGASEWLPETPGKLGRSGTEVLRFAAVGANVTAFADTGLSPRTTYRYRVRAYNDSGDSAYSNIAKATTKR